MRTIVLLALLVAAAAMYFGYQPYDSGHPLAPKPAPVKHHHEAGRPSVRAAVLPEAVNKSIAIAPAPDGSLDQRWIGQSDPPGKP